MGNTHIKQGSGVFLYVDEKYKGHIRKKERNHDKFPRFIKLEVMKVVGSNNDANDITALLLMSAQRHFKQTCPYGGYGIIVSQSSANLFTEDDFERLTKADDSEITSLCDSTGFSKKEFLRAIKPWRNDKRKLSEEETNTSTLPEPYTIISNNDQEEVLL